MMSQACARMLSADVRAATFISATLMSAVEASDASARRSGVRYDGAIRFILSAHAFMPRVCRYVRIIRQQSRLIYDMPACLYAASLSVAISRATCLPARLYDDIAPLPRRQRHV